ncbi:regulatory protein RecX [uncultured Methylibium sp.]|uniref:regulatory protein RecX n=1 Tax=uncultured Methylibium sp. TaxID=381093 RepID=UPI0025D51AC8|nr:regulatory protein RecX [uncultured Methylibium sp.]
MPRALATLKAKALACIAQREHSRVELRRKLLAHVDKQRRQADDASDIAPHHDLPPEQAVDELLDWLVAKDLLSTPRFVETRIQVRASRFGNLRIRHELAQHGVELDVAAAADLKRSEVARARVVWAKRFGAVAADAAGRAKQMRFLAARGFSTEVVRRVVAGGDDALET